MAKKKKEDESSLELLLDTMCNTFGGVMFIGIALVVLMAMMTNALPDTAADQNRKMQKTLEELQQKIEQLSLQNEKMESELKTLENDPRRELIREVITLEEAQAKIKLEVSALEQIQTLLKQEEQIVKTQQITETEKLAKWKAEKQEKERILRTIEEKLAKMKQQLSSASAHPMTFRVMEKSKLRPYFLIVSQNRIWRVGPNIVNQKFIPDADCSFRELTLDGTRVIQCLPVEGKGIPILADGQVSAQTLSLLKSIPPDRVPDFSISRDSFQSFSVLREYLKKAHILHGVDTEFDRTKNLSYQISQNAEYEY